MSYEVPIPIRAVRATFAGVIGTVVGALVGAFVGMGLLLVAALGIWVLGMFVSWDNSVITSKASWLVIAAGVVGAGLGGLVGFARDFESTNTKPSSLA
jgi:hypothetical protein